MAILDASSTRVDLPPEAPLLPLQASSDALTDVASPISLQTLPQEVLARIASHLEPIDLLSLDRTCRTIHEIIVNKEVWKIMRIKVLIPSSGKYIL